MGSQRAAGRLSCARMTVLLSTERLTRRFAARHGAEDVSVCLNEGEIVGLAGLNGAGKSTTLAMLAGVLRPTSGKVMVAGKNLFRDHLSRRRIGFAPDHPPLYPELTVREYLDFSASLRGLKNAAARKAVDRVMERSRLNDVGRRLIRTLSRGYQQRVGLAQALVHDPSILLLDEPTEGLDQEQTAHFRQLIADGPQSRTVLLSTHQMDVIAGLCNRLLILHEGRLVSDTPLDSETTAELQSLFATAVDKEAG